jgi:hypothetical protein
MAQTTGAINAANGITEVSSNNSTWKDISGSLISMIPAEQTRNTGSRTTIDGDQPIILVGKKQPHDVAMLMVYTDITDEAFDVMETIWNTEPPTIYIRYFPEGKESGNKMYSSGKGSLKSFQHPALDSASNDPIACSSSATIPGWTEGTYTTG